LERQDDQSIRSLPAITISPESLPSVKLKSGTKSNISQSQNSSSSSSESEPLGLAEMPKPEMPKPELNFCAETCTEKETPKPTSDEILRQRFMEKNRIGNFTPVNIQEVYRQNSSMRFKWWSKKNQKSKFARKVYLGAVMNIAKGGPL
jgi:hypothetical protein